jgi:hypothetical protein
MHVIVKKIPSPKVGPRNSQMMGLLVVPNGNLIQEALAGIGGDKYDREKSHLPIVLGIRNILRLSANAFVCS